MSTRRGTRRTVILVVGICLAGLLFAFGTVAGMLFATKAPPARRPQRNATRTAGGTQLKDPLLRELDGVLDQADELEDDDLQEARRILHEADPILTKAKEENRRALEMANTPPPIGQSHRRRPEKTDQPPAADSPPPKTP